MLNEKGIPTPLVHTMLHPPKSRMDILQSSEIDAIVSNSTLASKYNQETDSKSAYEMLNEKLELAAEKSRENEEDDADKTTSRKAKKEESFLDNPAVRQAGRTAASILTRSLLGALGVGGSTRRRKSRSFF